MQNNVELVDFTSPIDYMEVMEEPRKNPLTNVSLWLGRQWTNLSQSDFLIKTGKTLLYATPFAIIDIFFPQYSLATALSVLAIQFFARELGWITPYALKGWGASSAFDCVQDLRVFAKSGSPVFLTAALVNASLSLFFFLAGNQCEIGRL